jgi:hypothetical protein
VIFLYLLGFILLLGAAAVFYLVYSPPAIDMSLEELLIDLLFFVSGALAILVANWARKRLARSR